LRTRPGPGLFPEPTGEVSLVEWELMNREQRSSYEIGQLTLRNDVYELSRDLSPLERGRDLRSLGSLGIIRTVNPLNFSKTWRTGLTPAARQVVTAPEILSAPQSFFFKGSYYVLHQRYEEQQAAR